MLGDVLSEQPRLTPWVFPNPRTQKPYTTVAASIRRALVRARITTGDVSLHTLRHTAISRMIESGIDDYTVMEVSGHSSTRMLARYTHPTEHRKQAALESFSVVTNWSHGGLGDRAKSSGPHGARTHDLRVAKVTYMMRGSCSSVSFRRVSDGELSGCTRLCPSVPVSVASGCKAARRASNCRIASCCVFIVPAR